MFLLLWPRFYDIKEKGWKKSNSLDDMQTNTVNIILHHKSTNKMQFYLKMLREMVLSQMQTKSSWEELFFQQDGTP